MRKQLSFFDAVQAFAVLYLIVWSISPPLGIAMIYRLLALGLAAVWALIAFMRGFRLENMHIAAAVFIVGVAIVAFFDNWNFSDIIRQISIYMLFVEFLMFSFYYSKNKLDDLSILIPIILLILIYFNYNTFKALLEDPTLSRIIVRNDESANEYMLKGIGGYALVYAQVLFFPAGLFWTLNMFRRSKLKFIIGAAWLVTYVLLFMNAGYSIAVFSTVASVIVLFFYKRRSVVGVVVLTMIMFIGSMVLILYVTPFREWLLTTFDGTAVAKKINDLVATSESGEAEGSIQSRIEVYMITVRALLRYPIIGLLWFPGVTGGHSGLFDVVALYGWVGGFIYGKVLFSVPNEFKNDNYNNNSLISVINAQLVAMIFIAVLDSLPYQLMCSYLLIIPILLNDIKNMTGDSYESSVDG